MGLYVDKHSIFRVSRENSRANEGETQLSRLLQDLDIELICADNPQAKGRVERANRTIQDRLIKEMRLIEISTIEEAIDNLAEFIEEYNRKFVVEPRDPEDAQPPLRTQDALERKFARRSTRKISKSLTFLV